MICSDIVANFDLFPSRSSFLLFFILPVLAFSARTPTNKWMGIGSVVKRQSLVAETTNMTPLGGADHASQQRWTDLQLPFADFIVGARRTLIRCECKMSLIAAAVITTHTPVYRVFYDDG